MEKANSSDSVTKICYEWERSIVGTLETCSFSEYGLLRTTGMLPFPHRSLKTRSFSTPRGRGLCDLPSRSLKGKAGEVEEDRTPGVAG